MKSHLLEKRLPNYQEIRTVPFTIDQIQSVVVDVAKYQEFIPWCLESTILERKSNDTFKAELVIGFQVLKVTKFPNEAKKFTRCFFFIFIILILCLPFLPLRPSFPEEKN